MKKVLKMLCVVLLVALTAGLTVAVLSGCQHYTTLVVYNWGDYIDTRVNDIFEAEYYEKTGERIHIDYQEFDINEDMYTKFKTTPDEYDILCPSDYMVEKLIREGLVQKLNYDNIPNMKTVDESVLGLDYDPNTEYTVPNYWGTLGILYNKTKVSEAQVKEAGWGILWNSTNIPGLNGKILMKNSLRDALVATAAYRWQDKLLGMNAADRKQTVYDLINMTENLNFTNADAVIRDSERLLTELNQSISAWEVDDGKESLINETNYVNLAWSGDAVFAMIENEDYWNKNKRDDEEREPTHLAYYVPEAGSNIWVDAWVVSSRSKRKDLAEAYANFLLRPDIALMNMAEVGYTSAVKREVLLASDALAEYGGSEFLNDDVKYPTERDLAICAPMRDFGDKEEKIGEMWMRTSVYRDR